MRLRAGIFCALALASPAMAARGPDPLLEDQWPLATESALGRVAAWQQTLGAGQVVAILDTGADFTHPDLQGAFWTNPGEIAGNGVDDDRNGFVDDVHGADIVNSDGDPADDEGHGTHVAGIIGARAGNAQGGAGLAPEAQLMIVKVLDDRRSGTAAGLAEGIRYALAQGAKVINTSVNGDGVSRPLQDAIRAAGAAGALVVASSGNDGRDIDLQPSFPASYADPSIVTVAAAGADGALASYSNRGLIAVDLAAPGDDVLSTAQGGGYEQRSGTSMAAPFVSATLALLRAARPELEGSALKAALLGGLRVDDLLGNLVGGGALDAAGALRGVIGASDWQGSVEPLSLGGLTASVVRRRAQLAWQVSGDFAPVAALRILVDGREVARRSPVGAARVRLRARPGRHRWRVVALDAGGSTLAQAAGRFTVRR